MMKEYKVTVYYIDKNDEQKSVVHRHWGETSTDEIVRTYKILEPKYNKDICKIVGVSVQPKEG